MPMKHRKRRLSMPALALAGAAIVAAGTATVAFATPSQTPPVDPPSVAQLCAATGVAAVDAYLATVTESQLVGGLAPLVELTAPRPSGGLALEADVSLVELRVALGCNTTPTPTVTSTPSPTTTPKPDDDDDDDDDGCRKKCSQVTPVPRGGVDTGVGPTSLTS